MCGPSAPFDRDRSRDDNGGEKGDRELHTEIKYHMKVDKITNQEKHM